MRDWWHASVAEPADAPGLGPGVRKDVGVRVSPLAPSVTCGFELQGANANAAVKAVLEANANQVLGKISLPISVPCIETRRLIGPRGHGATDLLQPLPVRGKWGPGTAADRRALDRRAKSAPMTQVALARAVGVSQPRASQVLKHFAEVHAASASPRGYRGRPARLLELYRDRARPHLAAPETFWFSTRPFDPDQAHRITDIARGEAIAVAFSADLGPDLLAPWRHPTLAIVYADRDLPLDSAGLVPRRRPGRTQPSSWRRTSDATLLDRSPEPGRTDGRPRPAHGSSAAVVGSPRLGRRGSPRGC